MCGKTFGIVGVRVLEVGYFGAVTYPAVIWLEDITQLINHGFAAKRYIDSGHLKLQFESFIKAFVSTFVTQQTVTLLKCRIIPDERVEIPAVALRYYTVDKPTAFR